MHLLLLSCCRVAASPLMVPGQFVLLALFMLLVLPALKR
jgi:hypothetical protein